jgi:hypothetical protein
MHRPAGEIEPAQDGVRQVELLVSRMSTSTELNITILDRASFRWEISSNLLSEAFGDEPMDDRHPLL